MKKIITYTLILLLISFTSACKSAQTSNTSNSKGLVPVHLTENTDSSANVTFDSSIENIIEKKIPLVFKAGAKWEKIETTQYVLPQVAVLIAQGKMKVVVSQEKTSEGGIKNSISFEPNK